MIQINEEKIEWRDGMTVRDAMNEVKYSFPLVIVSVNGKVIEQKHLDKHIINDNDKIKVFHLISGG
ncbi:sulfur carrier protein ThiS [bacterium]|nr:sulfur carrier protein ThiS [bacterium]